MGASVGSLVLAAALACARGPSPEAAGPDPAPAIAPSTTLVAVAETPLRLQPSDADAVPHPRAPGRMLHNVIGVVGRGSLMSARASRPFWHQVVLDDDAEGWLSAAAVVPAEQLSEATVLADTPAYARADATAARVARVAAGELLLVLERTAGSPAYAEAFVASGARAFVPRAALTTAADELGVSHLVARARMARRMNDADGASDALAEARQRFPAAALLPALADEADFFTRRGAVAPHRLPLPPRDGPRPGRG